MAMWHPYRGSWQELSTGPERIVFVGDHFNYTPAAHNEPAKEAAGGAGKTVPSGVEKVLEAMVECRYARSAVAGHSY